MAATRMSRKTEEETEHFDLLRTIVKRNQRAGVGFRVNCSPGKALQNTKWPRNGTEMVAGWCPSVSNASASGGRLGVGMQEVMLTAVSRR